MAQFKILHTGAPADEPLDLERQGLAGLDVEIIQPGRLRSEDEIIKHGQDADILFVIAEPITRRVISSLPRLKGVVRYGIGVDTVDLKAATEFGVVVANFPDFCLDEVANHTMALLLALNRRLFRLDRVVRDGRWNPAALRSVLPGIGSLQGETLGLVAFGNIPRRSPPGPRPSALRSSPTTRTLTTTSSPASGCAGSGGSRSSSPKATTSRPTCPLRKRRITSSRPSAFA